MSDINVAPRSDSDLVVKILDHSLGIIEFYPTGEIFSEHENFCKALDYGLPEINGRHHSLFVDPDDARSANYKAFWAKLGRGEFDATEYRHIGKGGRD